MDTAVIDIGKTNIKLTVVNHDREPFYEARGTNHVLPGPPYPHHDLDGIWEWLIATLGDAARRTRIGSIVTTAHGATAVLMAGDRPALPALDYEHPIPPSANASYEALRGDFTETGSPSLPRGLNLGRQLYWQRLEWPQAFSKITDILTYPQYWTYRLSGKRAAEVTSLGCHTDLWSPSAGGYSRLAREQGWDRLTPTILPAWQVVGTVSPAVAADCGLAADTRVINGIHDSNASYLAHLVSSTPPFTVVSSGTWVICMAAGGSLECLRADQDTLVNVDAYGTPVPCARFMGGREYAAVAGHEPGTVTANAGDVSELIVSGILALPGFADQGGPFAHRSGTITPQAPSAPRLREALAALYTALLTDYCLNMIGASGEIAVEGSLARNALYLGILAALRPRQPVVASKDAAGTTAGAALLSSGAPPPIIPRRAPQPVPPIPIGGLNDYRTLWLAGIIPRG